MQILHKAFFMIHKAMLVTCGDFKGSTDANLDVLIILG